ncbi:triosephosphate isomerase [Desulfarculus baarsii DSM 2075]|uniref:Triosephosphate isomerase n=1 Tax=Desulfarculus baarsii (strain ATCC 33931 / DSM 2075 / LMG 7858 / VKM B-1802 / 2st14) TaxID=644282 RepID=E1QL68_DESB2|nr:triose-phosphate isomerase [Desulfarculus baarsii]ADK85333.1 triosephosphate isomerase [Desulfarculus baarsii DSM 2075]
MNRRIMVAGNWKMYKTIDQAVALAKAVAAGPARQGLDVLLCPNFVCLEAVVRAVAGSHVQVGGQNLHWQDEGAFTAEISGPMLRSVGASHVIIGHSERRQFFGETEKTVRMRLAAALRHGLKPIVCVGETQAERESGQTDDVLASQLAGGLAGLSAAEMVKVTLAYEPVWAIGTGLTASDEQAQQVHAFIRAWLAARFDNQVANSCGILYGGSVKPANAAGLLRQKDIDGALVGGASLDADSFLGIIAAV